MNASRRGLEMGRLVTIADLVAVHPGKPEKCLCRGSGEVRVFGGIAALNKPCERAVSAFRARCADRVVDTPRGPRWKPGMSPDEWGFTLMFLADVREFAWREQLRRRLAVP